MIREEIKKGTANIIAARPQIVSTTTIRFNIPLMTGCKDLTFEEASYIVRNLRANGIEII